MDIEKPEALHSARSTLPSENAHQNESSETAHVQKLEPAPESTDPMEDGPPLTHALEALLGGLDNSISPIDEPSAPVAPVVQVAEFSEQLNDCDPMVEDMPAAEVENISKNKDLAMVEDTPAPAIQVAPVVQIAEISEPLNGSDPMVEDAATENGPSVEGSAAKPAISGLFSLAEEIHTASPVIANQEPLPVAANAEAPDVANGNGEEQEHPEWEVDSSPIESSSDDSSSDDSSSDESEDGDSAYKLLSPEEQARILMQGDGGSDDEGDSKTKGTGGQLRTKNEVPDVVIPKPNVTITEDMQIQELGAVETIVENILLIKAQTSGEYKVLESGSVLCLADRSVIGVVAETLGRVQQPLYSVLFTNAGEIKEAGLEKGTKVFYSEAHSTYVFTQALKAYKGSDASNLHDEEVGDEEMEFSDDEAEAEHKRRVKQKRLEKRGGKMQQNGGSGRGGHPLQQQHSPHDASNGISYDDNDDGPYKPLTRPAGYADSVSRSEAPQEGSYQGSNNDRSPPNREQFRGRGRGDRGRGRGDSGRGRGRGRGGYQDRRNENDGNSHPQPPRNHASPPNPGSFQSPSFPPYQQQAQAPSMMMNPNFYMQQQYSPLQPQLPTWPPFIQPRGHQSFQNMWPNMPPPPPPLPGGAFINPAFFNNQQSGNQHQNQWKPKEEEK